MKKILIIFPDHWFSYSPTAINIFSLLSEKYDVQVIALELEVGRHPACARFDNERIHYVKFPQIPQLLWRILCKIELAYNKFIGKYFAKADIRKMIQAIMLFFECRKVKADEVIAVDAVGFYVAQAFFKKIHFVSLEISIHDIFYQKLVKDVSKIESVIIQSEERLKLLNLPLKIGQRIFIVQNAPIYDNEGAHNRGFNNKMVYFGSGNLAMGIRYLFEYFSCYKNYSLMFKGLFDINFINRNFQNITAQANIQFDSSYTSIKDIQKYLSDYSIGLCFYDFDYVADFDRQNMLHGPSGKIFSYFTAGLPVIALNIPGFKIVKEYEAGILLEKPTPENIHSAIERIKSNYCSYSENSRRAAKDCCFRKAFLPFIEYVSDW